MSLAAQLSAVLALFLAAQAPSRNIAPTAPPSTGTPYGTGGSASLMRRAVAFEPNVGQFQPRVRYRADGAGLSLSLTDAAAELALGPEGARRQVRVTPVGASRHARPLALDRLAGVVNHFEGTAPSAWHAGVPTFGRVRYAALYPGIDLVYHGSPDRLEYDFLVGRGADPSRIVVRFDGADRIEIDPAGDLLIHAGDTVVRQRAPDAWQEHGHERRRVDVRYRLTAEGDVAFAIGAYDRRLPLVIDPILIYASYVNTFYSKVAIDGAGYLIVATEADRTSGGTSSGLKVERLTADGRTAIYTTLIGTVGTDFFTFGGLAATVQGEAILTGSTQSPNLPLVNASQGYPGDTDLTNAFVVKLGADGSFVFSTYLGGTGYDGGRAVSVNASGTIAVAGGTSSADFPGIDGLHYGVSEAGFVTLFSPAGARLHGALLPEGLSAVAIDAPGMVYVATTTYRKTWPTTPTAFQPTPSQSLCVDTSAGPCLQGALAKLTSDLRSLAYSTYLHETAPTGWDEVRVRALAVDGAGAAYILGYGRPFGATPGALFTECPGAVFSCPFLTKLNPAGSDRVYSTFLPALTGVLQVDARGNAYLAGGAYPFPKLAGFPATPNAQQPQVADAQLFVTTDGGTTWRAAQPPSESYGAALGHAAGPVLYAGPWTSDPNAPLFRSNDLGGHWVQIDSQFLGFLVVAPSNANVLYQYNGATMRRSSDGGATWTIVPFPIFIHAFAVDPSDAQTLYIGDTGGLFKSVNGGSTWSPAGSGLPAGRAIQAISVAPSNRNLLIASVWEPYPLDRYDTYRSIDGGANWTKVAFATGTSIIGGVTFDPSDPMRGYATRLSGGLLRTLDGGVTWSLFADCFCTAQAVTRTPDPTVFVSSLEGGLARVIDTGGTVSPPLPRSLGNGGVYGVLVDPVDPRTMVAITSSVGDSMVAVLDPTGARVRYASYFGGADSDSVSAIAIGPGGTLAMTGFTESWDLPLVNPRVSQRGTGNLPDSYVAVMRIPLTTVVLDAPDAGAIAAPFSVSGWAIDESASTGPGVDAVHVWALPHAGGAPVFVGAPAYGSARPDVGSLFGAQFTNSGFSLTGASLPAGSYTLAAFARSTVSGMFDAAVRTVQVRPGGRMSVDVPVAGASLYQPFTIAGWALDTGAPSGTGIDTLHVWAIPPSGVPRFVGVATYGVARPDVGAVFGSRFTASGFTLQASGLPPGDVTLAIFAHSLVSGTFDQVRTVRVTIPDGGAASIDIPRTASRVSVPFAVAGWALDRQGTGTGVDAVHVWAHPVLGGAPVFLGVASAVSRPDVAAAYGDPRFEPSGYALTVSALPPGTYTVAVYAHSVVTGAFSIVRTTQVTVLASSVRRPSAAPARGSAARPGRTR